MIGETLGSYLVLDQLSVGGMGTIYRAEHTLLGRIVAVKVLHPEMCGNRDIVNRFFNEAKATTAIKHPGIVEIFDFGYMASGHAYLVMEFLEGMTLAQRMEQRGPIHEGEAAMIMRGVCSALAAAHLKGIVHRDLKPDNIFVLPDPDSPLGQRCKLLDFGIAKLTDIGLAGSATKTGTMMGTPTYMSPEQCRGTGNVDHRADLYSLGCIFYELLTGRPPFVERGAGELIAAHLFVPPDSPSAHIQGISPEAETLAMTLLHKQPDERVQTARDLGAYLMQIAEMHGWRASATDDSRISMQSIVVPTTGSMMTPVPTAGAATPPPAAFTPAAMRALPPLKPYVAPPKFTLSEVRAPVALSPYGPTLVPSSAPEVVTKPTTLSGAASETASPTRKSRAPLAIALGIGALAVVGGVAFMVVGRDSTSQSAGQPPAPIAAPAAKPEPPVPAPVEPVKIEPVKIEPVVAPVEPVNIESVEPVKIEPKKHVTKPAVTKPAVTKPAVTKPVVKPKPKPKADPKKKDDLLETDL